MSVFFPRRRDDSENDPPEPVDDTTVFDIRRRQQRLRETGQAHTRRKMQQVWDTILKSLQEERNRMRWEDE